MQLPQQVRDRFTSDSIPHQAYAVVGASLLVRDRIAAVPQEAEAQLRSARSTKDRWVTTAYQKADEARDRAHAVPSQCSSAAHQAWGRAAALPQRVLTDVTHRVAQLRDEASQRYTSLAGSGERAVAEYHAQRVLDERAKRFTESVTPAAARASVSARDAARRAAASPAAQRAGEVGRQARASAQKAWAEYVAAADEAGPLAGGYPGTAADPAIR